MSFKSFLRSRFALQSGVSLVELTVALSLFAVVAVGAFSALSVFDQTKQSQITQKNAAQDQRRDFLQAYNRILDSPDSTPSFNGLNLSFHPIPVSDSEADLCQIAAFADNNTTLKFYSSTNQSVTGNAGCPAELVLSGAYQLASNGTRPIFFGVDGTGKLCEGNFKTGTDFDNASNAKQLTVQDKDCLRKPDGSLPTTSDTLLFPEYLVYNTTTGTAASEEINSAIFFPFDRLTEPSLAKCAVTTNLEFPITGFDIDGDAGHDASDVVSSVTITISRGFIAAEDRLYIRNATDNSSLFSTATNGVGDVVHSYSNISTTTVPTFPSGVTLTTATYNAAQGFMRLNASSALALDTWEQVFDEIIYINRFSADTDPMTSYTPLDKEIVYSLGQYPARKVDGDYHFYNFEDCSSLNCVTWTAAFNEAKGAGKNHLGLGGYLATITSDEENIFVSDRARSQSGGVVTWAAGWLGATGRLNNTEGDTLCPDITARGTSQWYWVTGKEGAEKCTLFWSGLSNGGQPVDINGAVIPSSDINPHSTTDWNCDAPCNGTSCTGNVVNVAAVPSSPASHAGLSLREAWWYPDRRGRDNTTVRYANWSGGSINSATCVWESNNVWEPNECCANTNSDDNTIGEHYLQMTGLPSGQRLWNDLHGTFYSGYVPEGWYGVRGYLIEWDPSGAAPDVVLAREARLNTRRHQEICAPVFVSE